MSEQAAPIPLLVLDTNVVLDWVVFDDARVRPAVIAIESGGLRVATSDACAQELRRTLGYAQLGLNAEAQARAYARYVACASVFEVPATGASHGLPQCEDPDDQKFLELAWHANASCLLTRDQALLKLAPRVAKLGRFAVMTPQAFEPSC